MVRIATEQQGSTRVVHVHGQLGHDNVPVLDEACRAITGPLCLDLSELRGLDQGGVESIQAAVEKGATVSGASPYIKLRLDNHRGSK